jgi:hypothetical protein
VSADVAFVFDVVSPGAAVPGLLNCDPCRVIGDVDSSEAFDHGLMELKGVFRGSTEEVPR